LEEPYNDHTFLKVDGVFIEIGSDPGVQIAEKIGVELDNDRYIKVSTNQSTNLPGIFAAGDVTTGSNKFRQVLTACAEGAIAADSVYRLLKLS
jgi:thioredoxin reductase (NADPH)